MRLALSSERWTFISSQCDGCVLVYIDDIAIYPKTTQEHIEHVRKTLILLRDAGVTLNLKSASSLLRQSITRAT